MISFDCSLNFFGFAAAVAWSWCEYVLNRDAGKQGVRLTLNRFFSGMNLGINIFTG